MMHSRLESMKEVARSLRKYKAEIIECFKHRITNAFAEGMNSLIQAAKRKARGFRIYEGYRTITMLSVQTNTIELIHINCIAQGLIQNAKKQRCP